MAALQSRRCYILVHVCNLIVNSIGKEGLQEQDERILSATTTAMPSLGPLDALFRRHLGRSFIYTIDFLVLYASYDARTSQLSSASLSPTEQMMRLR